MSDTRQLKDLAGIGKAMLKDLDRLGITSVAQLAEADGQEMYDRIGAMDGKPHDPCVLDTYRCAVAQARDPDLPKEMRNWWWWSRQRKGQL